MQQFNPKTLSRLLRNVDHAILAPTVEAADLWDIFGSFERSALIQLGETQISLANLALFEADSIEVVRSRFKGDIEKIRSDAGFFGKMLAGGGDSCRIALFFFLI